MVEQQEYGETNYLLLHLTKEGTALADRRVRCALSMAINRVELIDAINGGILTPANGPFSPGQQGYLDGQRVLDRAGHRCCQSADRRIQGRDRRQRGQGAVRPRAGRAPRHGSRALQGPGGRRSASRPTFLTVEQSAFITNALIGIPDFEIYSWRNNAGIYVDQQNVWWGSATAVPEPGIALNFGRLRDPVIDDLLAQARSETDAAKLTAIAEDINREFGKECWIIPTRGRSGASRTTRASRDSATRSCPTVLVWPSVTAPGSRGSTGRTHCGSRTELTVSFVG
jgi:ABC-type transport system substrate-binding protein